MSSLPRTSMGGGRIRITSRMNTRAFAGWMCLVMLLTPGGAQASFDGHAPALGADAYTYAYWLNGWRQPTHEPSADILCFETGSYGFTLDVGDFSRTKFGRLDDGADYGEALEAGTRRLRGLDPAQLDIALEVDGTVYRAVSCKAGREVGAQHLQFARLWESGRLVQHFDFLELVLESDEGKRLACDATLEVVAWPNSLTLSVSVLPGGHVDGHGRGVVERPVDLPHQINPPEDPAFQEGLESGASEPEGTPVWSDITLRLGLHTDVQDWVQEKRVSGSWAFGEKQGLTLICELGPQAVSDLPVTVRLTTEDHQRLEAPYQRELNAYVAEVGRIRRSWQTGYTDIRNYDDVELRVENRGDDPARVPVMVYLRDVANITGLVPMLCAEDGTPTGIPVQLSKNWHHAPLGAYLRAFAWIPVEPGTTTYTLRVAYGFYGTLPSASHAQLSLVGYGGNGRWEQLAIGCWGETFCLDMDMSCVTIAVTDVRMLMTRDGLQGGKWNWSDGGWGGDWLCTYDSLGRKNLFSAMKTAYRAHGPCLTEVGYDGNYGAGREISMQATVRTLRTDDYARTFHSLRYSFNEPVPADRGWLFKMGKTRSLVTPEIAYGNRDGLIETRDVTPGLEPGDRFVDRVVLEGEGPWWVAFPGAYFSSSRQWGTGSRGLVIRSYQASFGGKTYTAPTLTMPVNRVQSDGRLDLDLLLVPPRGVSGFEPGDRVDMDVEWITVPRIADDYYGPNESFRKHLADHPRSWRTVYREAVGNDLSVQVVGGSLRQSYPILIEAEAPEVTVAVTGGVGAVPIRFEGLPSATGHVLYRGGQESFVALDQSVHGNDFWQTDYDAKTKTYSITYNVPLDGVDNSTWVLSREGQSTRVGPGGLEE